MKIGHKISEAALFHTTDAVNGVETKPYFADKGSKKPV
jgi:hypothetical protein